MTGKSFESIENAARPEDGRRLDSWKEIAAYLQRDVKTAHRWEKYEGLPVHRHHHLSRSSVYAYASELEAWRAGRGPVQSTTGWWRPVPAFASTIVIALSLMMASSGPHIGSVVQAADGIVTRQVWSGPEVSTELAVSPDGRYLALKDVATWDLAVRDLTTGEKRRLTHKVGGRKNWHEAAMFPVFSPDGTQVAFGWANAQDSCELHVVGTDGSGLRVLDPGTKHGVFPMDWSQDGKSILVLLLETLGRQVAVVSTADGSVRVLKTIDWTWSGPGTVNPDVMRFSPDGRFLVYDRPVDGAGNYDVYAFSIATGEVTSLVQHPAQDRMLGWAPDGRSVLFLSDRTGSWAAYLVEVVGGKPQGEPRLVKRDMGAIRPIGFARNGSFYCRVRDPGRNIYTATIGGGTPSLLSQRFLGSNGGPNGGPAWSPDGKRVAYISNRPSGRTLIIRSMETGEEQEYLPKLSIFVRPQWSPDGRSVLVLGADLQGRRGQFLVDLETGQVTPALRGLRSPDGKAIYYIERRDVKTKRPARIMRRDLGTGQEEEIRILPLEANASSLRPSPDGRWFALLLNHADDTWSFAVVPVSGGEIRELPGPWRDVKQWRLTWSPDSQQLMFFRPGGEGGKITRSELWAVSIDGGQQRSLGFSVPHKVSHLSVHPDGKQLVFAMEEESTEVWVMENFLPGSEVAAKK